MKPPSDTSSAPCPLCGASAHWYYRDRRDYFHCPVCDLVHVPANCQLDSAAERSIYDLHQNVAEDPGYQKFLSRLTEPLKERLGTSGVGLDFGCGPAPALALMLEQAGHQVCLHDIYYYPNPEVFDRQWDFITATEVVEHLSQPTLELDRLWRCLKPGGWLGIMTKRVTSQEAFASWHYKNDLTHISFFSSATFHWLAEKWAAKLDIIGADVVLLQKPERQPLAVND
ncbi:MAG TPA: class I SAM-dependent methyltransferase [Pseudomonas xinjiangensis]|uniref:Class I SAM-dependent methyltransferase n=2 Tax=root TaxID=1 RepID=A0A7V1FT61_9GAMM|nr:class I SAM-dependent methyltransferase [Halopseudomonas xinjiangensis]HEC48826.1 class I SAM-dependent methyltransferase [Halopseudomonas xinjiangensis]